MSKFKVAHVQNCAGEILQDNLNKISELVFAAAKADPSSYVYQSFIVYCLEMITSMFRISLFGKTIAFCPMLKN